MEEQGKWTYLCENK